MPCSESVAFSSSSCSKDWCTGCGARGTGSGPAFPQPVGRCSDEGSPLPDGRCCGISCLSRTGTKQGARSRSRNGESLVPARPVTRLSGLPPLPTTASGSDFMSTVVAPPLDFLTCQVVRSGEMPIPAAWALIDPVRNPLQQRLPDQPCASPAFCAERCLSRFWTTRQDDHVAHFPSSAHSGPITCGAAMGRSTPLNRKRPSRDGPGCCLIRRPGRDAFGFWSRILGTRTLGTRVLGNRERLPVIGERDLTSHRPGSGSSARSADVTQRERGRGRVPHRRRGGHRGPPSARGRRRPQPPRRPRFR